MCTRASNSVWQSNYHFILIISATDIHTLIHSGQYWTTFYAKIEQFFYCKKKPSAIRCQSHTHINTLNFCDSDNHILRILYRRGCFIITTIVVAIVVMCKCVSAESKNVIRFHTGLNSFLSEMILNWPTKNKRKQNKKYTKNKKETNAFTDTHGWIQRYKQYTFVTADNKRTHTTINTHTYIYLYTQLTHELI